MTPAKPLPFEVPETSTSWPVSKVSTVSSWPSEYSAASAEFDQVAARGHAGLVEVALLGLVDLARVDLAPGDLDGLVAVGRGVAHLGHDTRSSLDHGDRDDPVVRVPDLGHPELLAQDALDLAR